MVIKRNDRGRAVYADRDYIVGEIIEACDVIVIPKKELGLTDILMFYVFVWNTNDYALLLGNGSLYNHSYHPNMSWKQIDAQIVFRATHPIKAGEELTHNYNGGYDRQEVVYFLDEERAKFARGESS